MISQSSIESSDLDKKYLDSLIALLKSRNNLKYPIDSPENKIVDTLPIFDRNQINIFSNKIKSKEDVKNALVSIGFPNNYKYNSTQLQEIQSQHPPDISIIVAYFQILARVYFHEKLSSDDFSLIMEVLNSLIPRCNKEFINSAFYILYSKAQSSHIVWSENCVQQVLLFFEKNNSLTHIFYNILIHYLSLFVQANEKDKQTIRILKMLQHIFKSNYPIVQVSDLSKIVDLIHPLLFNFNSDSLLVFAYISKIDKESTEKDIRIFPEFFTTLALKNADLQNMTIRVNKQERIHDLPAVFTGHTPDLEYKIQNIDTFHNTFYPIPIELYKRNNQLGNLIPENTRTIIRSSLRDFFEVLDPKLTRIFFQEMNKALVNCMNSDDYNGFAAYLYLLHYSITNNSKMSALSKQYLDDNIPYFFPKPKLSNKNAKIDNEISFGDMFYNPENTVFGPLALDPIINIFRTAILFLTTSTNLYKFVESLKGCPFLMAEQIGRLCLRFDTEIFSSFNKCSEQIFRTISREMVVLQMQNAQAPARNAFFLFFIHFLTDEKKVGDCLKSTVFVDSIFRYIFETGVMDQLLMMITRGFLLLNNDTYRKVNIEPSVAFLYTTAKRNEEIAPKIYQMVSEIIKYRPVFISKFDRFLDLMMDELQNKKTKESFDNAITLLELMANYYNQNNNNYSDSFTFFGPKYFRIIASHVNFASYEKLFNLMAGGYNLDTKGIFLIKQPPFIPLLFIAYAKDYNKINSIIEQFHMLATKSELNCRAFHDGDLDMILLKHLNKENPLKYRGFVIPPLNINEKVENTTVLNLLNLIISAKSNFAIVKKIMEIIIKGNNIQIAKLTNNILASTENVPTPSFAIGSLNHFCSITGLSDRLFRGDMSFTFWMKTDPIPLSNTTAVVNLISIIDKNDCVFSIILQNNLLFASYETRKKKTSVCLCQRMNSNAWTHFAITFSNNPTQKPLISTFKNFERLHDSEFCYLDFATGPIEVQFGGYTYNDRSPVYPNLQYGSLSKIFIYNRYISTEEIILILQGRDKMPHDYVVSSNTNNIDKNITVNFIMNHCVVESLKNCLSNDQVVNRFIESLISISSRPLIDQILSILDKIISFSKNKTISSRLAAILLNSDYADYRLYKTLENIISKINDKDTQKCWLEDVLINIPIWNRSNTFDAVLHDYSKLLLNYPQFFKKNYFFYFLNQFNILVNTDKEKRDESALKEFLIFIERYPIKKNSTEPNIEKGAVNNLICYATYARDEDKVTYLEIIEKIADSINQVSYNEYEYIFYFVQMNNIDIALHAILALHQLLMKSFHAIVYSILDTLTIPLDELFTRLEPYVKRYKNLFSLTCAIGLKTGQIPSQFPFNVTLSACWFVFPLLSAMVTSENAPFIDLIARNAVKSKDINLIMFMTTYLNLFAEQTQGKPNNNILQSILLALYRNHRADSNLDKKFQIFFHLFAASFFKINAPLMRNEIADMVEKKPESPKTVKKIKVVDYETFSQMTKNAEAFISDMEMPRSELRSKYYEMKKKRDALALQAAESPSAPQTDLKQDDEEFIHLESIIESVKSFKLRFKYTNEDLDLLKSAYTIFTHYLNNYTIEGIQSESSGTFFKTKIPAFGFDDLKQLMAKFIRIYQTNNTNNTNDELYERRLSLDSSSSNQAGSGFKSLSQFDSAENEEENIRLSKDEDNLSEVNHILKSSQHQISPSSTSPISQGPPQLPPQSQNSSSSQIIQSSPLASPSRDQSEQQLTNANLQPITPYEKQIKIFDYFAENLNSNMNSANFTKILQTIRPQKEFKKKIAPINPETCSNLVKSEEERAKRNKIINDKTVKFVRSNIMGYSMTPYLLKRQKSFQSIQRFNVPSSALTSPNAQLIKFNERSNIYFEVPFSAELYEQLQQQILQKQQQQQQQQQQNLADKVQSKKPISQPTKLSHLIRLSASSSSSITAPTFTNENDYIIQSKKRRIAIDKLKIINIFYINSTTMELIDNQNQPYLIQFNNPEGMNRCVTRIKIDKRCRFSINDEYNQSIIKYKRDCWIKGFLSTFHYLSILNFFTGRIYEDSSRYPYFPSLTPNSKITNIELPSMKLTFFPRKIKEESKNENDGQVQFENRLYVLPELYYLFESDTIENVYNRRKLLEEVSKTDKPGKDSRLLKWMEDVFNCSQVQRQILKRKVDLHQIFLEMDTESKIIYAAPFYRDSSFCIVLSTGEFRFFTVQLTEKNIQTELVKGKRKKSEIITDIDIEINVISGNNKKHHLDQSELPTLKFAPLNVGYIPDITALLNRYIKFGFVAYNNDTIHFVDLNGKITKENIYLENPIFHNAVVLSTPSTISPISSYLSLPSKTKNKPPPAPNNNNNVTTNNEPDLIENFVLCNVHAKVTCLYSSVIFGIIAIGSEDCKVRIRSLNDGKKIATVELDESEVPTMILITEGWGFVVVYCVNKMYILSVNGKLVKTCNKFTSFNQWFTFKSADDFDYIGIVNDHDMKLEYFEVMYPEKVKEVMLNGKIITMRYEPRFNCFMFLADNGKLTLIPADI